MKRPSPALVVAVIALVVALGGTSYAALSITGRDVRDGSLTGIDIRNGTLTGRDVRDGSLAATDFGAGQLPAGPQGPTGPQGAAGPRGEAGAKGDTGPRGPSDAVAAAGPDLVTFTGTGMQTMVSAQLQAGSWVLDASALVNNNDNGRQFGSCELDVGGTPVSAAGEGFNLDVQFGLDRTPVALTGATTITQPAAAELRCSLTGGNGTVGTPRLTAVRVEHLSGP